MADDDPDFARRRVAHYKELVAVYRHTIGLIDSGKMRFHETTAGEPTRDVTAKRRADLLQQIEDAEDAARVWGRDLKE